MEMKEKIDEQELLYFHSDAHNGVVGVKSFSVADVNSEESIAWCNGSMSKVDRYGWKIRDTEGDFMKISKNDLHIDRSYQRNVSLPKVLSIVKNWSWVACGCIIVAKRGDKYYAIDGQHRVMAAKKRVDIDHLPCIVFETSEVAQEANGFLVTQTARKPVSAVEKFNAMLVVGNEEALLVNDLIKASGRQIHAHHSSKSTIKCVARILTHAKINKEVLKDMWPLIVDISEGQPFRETILDGLMYAEIALRKQGKSLLEKHWSERLTKIGSLSLHKGAIEASQYTGFGGGRVWAFGICKVMNSGLRKRIELPGSLDAKTK